MFRREDCQSILIEAVSGEDLAADFRVPPEAALSRVTPELQPQSIEVQITG